MGQHPDVVARHDRTRRSAWAPAPAARATSPAPTTRWSSSRRELADLHGKEAALVFTSGYVSNEAGISTIARLLPDCLILSDALNHNSMIEGVRQSGLRQGDLPPQRPRPSRGAAAQAGRRAAEADRLRERLFDGRRHRADRRDLRPRRALRRHDLSRRGACGRHVRPARRRHRRARRRDGTASTSSRARSAKAFGVHGRLHRRHRARSSTRCARYAPGFIFTTALPPAVAAAATASIRHLKALGGGARGAAAPGRRAPRRRSPRAGLPVMPTATHIVPVMVGDAELCKAASDRLLERHGIYIQPINYPDRAARHRAPAHHAGPAPHRRADRGADGGAGRDLAGARPALRPARAGG